MKINISNATFSSIVGIGEKIAKIEKQTGRKFLKLNRGVNMVAPIDLSEITKFIDFNSPEFQLYAANTGQTSLKQAIIKEYCRGIRDNQFITEEKNISITPGGMPALDLVFQILHVENIHFPKFYWGSYSKVATIRKKSFTFYENFLTIDTKTISENDAFVLCDPSNPTGLKASDTNVVHKIYEITKAGGIVIIDCPYRKLFLPNLEIYTHDRSKIIFVESFSKWVGLPGLRLGFIYSQDENFNKELNIRLLYEFNGVSSPSQIILTELLSTSEGKEAIEKFQHVTRSHIEKNIQYLKRRNFLPDTIYGLSSHLMGIFAIVDMSEDFLLQHDIGSVGLDKFVYHDKDEYSSYSRICVSVPHEQFVEYFERIKTMTRI